MVAVHLWYDLNALYGLPLSNGFLFVQRWGGVLFLLLSGICVTLGRRHIRRGLTVFACGALCTAVTAAMAALGFADKSLIIRFGVLHCLGICMLLWGLARHLPGWALALSGVAIIAAGFYVSRCVLVEYPWFIWLGLMCPGFASSDYFPLLPNLGFFLLGSALGYRLYPAPVTRFPHISPEGAAVRFLCGCGKASLPVYLLHQPVLTVILGVIDL